MKIHTSLLLIASLTACTSNEPAQDEQGPPFVEDSLQVGGKGDGSLSAGSSQVLGQQSGYRSAEPVMFSCTPGGLVAFDVFYKNTSLPWGVKLDLWRGMAGEEWCGGCEPAYYGTFDWSDHQVTTMNAVGAWQWKAHTESYGYGSGAGGKFNEMKFVVRITMPDGSVRWDNGGSNIGYYRVLVPDPKCEATWTPWQTYDSKTVDLPVVAVPKY